MCFYLVKIWLKCKQDFRAESGNGGENLGGTALKVLRATCALARTTQSNATTLAAQRSAHSFYAMGVALVRPKAPES